MLSLLFSDLRIPLGEVETTQGSFARVMLTDMGETSIGLQVNLWQTRGIPTRQDMERPLEDGGMERVFFTDYVQMHDTRFRQALEKWCHERQMAVLTLSPEAVPCWEMLVHLPFEPEERFAFLIAILQSSPAGLEEWRRCLKEVQVLILHHREETRRAIDQLKERMSKQIQHPFTKDNE